MNPAAILNILVTADTAKATVGLTKMNATVNRSAKDMDRMTKKSGGSLMALGKTAAFVGTTGGFAVLGLGIRKAVDEAREAQKVGKDTAAVLKSTGGAANISAKQIAALADRLSIMAGVDDELVQKGENLLLTFTKVRNEVGKGNDVFTQATKLALDMSARMDQSLRTSIIQIGKALQDPIRGFTALRRVGVDLDTSQQSVIKRLVESGQTMKAQKVILAELRKEFGGSARANADAMDRLRAAVNNLFERFGTALLPIMTKVAGALARFIIQMDRGRGAGGQFVHTLQDIWKVIRVVIQVLVVWNSWLIKLPKAWIAVGRAGVHAAEAIVGAVRSAFRFVEKIVGDVMAGILRRFAKLFEVASHLPVIGGRFKDLADRANAAADRVDRLGEEVRHLPKNKQITISVKAAMQDFLSGKFKPLVDNPGGDGWGIERRVTGGATKAIQQGIRSGKINPFGDIGALPMFGGSTNLMGANANLGPFAALGARMGLHVSSGFRPGAITSTGNRSYHSMGRAIDMADGPASMLAYAQMMAATFGPRLKELIHTPLGFSIKNGVRVAPYATADHYDHVHVALQKGGIAVPGHGSGDKVPVQAMVEPHERLFVLNRNAVPAFDALNSMFPRFQSGGAVKPEYRRLIQMASKRYGIPARVLAGLIDVESGWNPNAVSPAGAFGLTQFMPGTASGYGVARGAGHHAVATQILGAAHYLKDLGYSRNRMFALGAYNGGPGNPQYGYAHDVLSASSRYRGIGAAMRKAKRHAKKVVKKAAPKKKATQVVSRSRMAGGDIRDAFMQAFAGQIAMREALAALTPGGADDILVAQDAIRGWQAWLDLALSRHDTSGITTAATSLKQWQDTLRDLTAPAAAAVDDSGRLALLQQLLTEANLRTGVSQAQYGVFRGMPTVGAPGFASGGVAPVVNVNLSGNASLLERFIDRRIEQKTRTARSTPLPGRGGGLQR